MPAAGLRADWEILVLDYGIGMSAHLCPSVQVFFSLFFFFDYGIGMSAHLCPSVQVFLSFFFFLSVFLTTYVTSRRVLWEQKRWN